MSFVADLHEQAQHLLCLDPRRPRQANLRRAISSTYYGLFHLLIGAAVSLLLPARLRGLRNQLARKFTHNTMKKIAQTWSPSANSRHLRDVANAFVVLQEARHQADYWSRVRGSIESEQFLVELLIGRV